MNQFEQAPSDTDTRIGGLRGEVSALLNMLDTDSERVRMDIRRLAAADPTFKRHWLEVLEVASDNRERDIYQAFRIWKALDPKDRPAPAEELDLEALEPLPTQMLTSRARQDLAHLGDAKDVRVWQSIHAQNQSPSNDGR